MAEDIAPEAALSPLRYSASDELSDPEYADALVITLTEVSGGSHVVAVGKTYLVRGTYVLNHPEVALLRLACQGRSQGRQSRLSSGSGKFAVTANVLEVVEGQENILDLLMADRAGVDLGLRLRINLEKSV
jgi:hypothetical protein